MVGRPRISSVLAQKRIASFAPGMTRLEWAEAIGVSYVYATILARTYGLTEFSRAPHPTWAKNRKRNEYIARRVSEGSCTLDEIGAELGISRQRVSKIAAKLGERSRIKPGSIAQDKDHLVSTCPKCGKTFSKYARRAKYCSKLCAALARKIPAETLWDGWCAWLRLGSVVRASKFAGMAVDGTSLARWIGRWGVRISGGISRRPKRARRKRGDA